MNIMVFLWFRHNVTFLLAPGGLTCSQGSFNSQDNPKATPLSLFKNLLTYHIVVLYPVDEHYGLSDFTITFSFHDPWGVYLPFFQGSFFVPRQTRKLILGLVDG
jgi:hypothetical protein